MGRQRKTDRHLPQRMYLRSGSYYFVDYNGKWINLGRVYAKAMVEYALFTDPDKPCKTIADLLERYLKEVAPLKAERTYQDNIKQGRYLRAALGHIQPDRLTAQMIYQYLDARGKNSQTQANRELALLSHMFTKAIRWGVVDRNPCKGVERFKEKPRDRYIQDWEYLAFRKFAGPLIGAYMDFKLLTGLRKGDILRLRLDHLKDDGIHAHISKTDQNVIFEWTDALRQAVTNIRKIKRPVTGLTLFCTRHGKPYTVSGFSSIWQRKMKEALAKQIIKERFTDHDIRAKAGSDADADQASKLLAHLDSQTTERHYRRKEKVIKPLF